MTKPLEIDSVLARMAIIDGQEAARSSFQRVVPTHWTHHSAAWLCGFDGKPWVYGGSLLNPTRKIRNTP